MLRIRNVKNDEDVVCYKSRAHETFVYGKFNEDLNSSCSLWDTAIGRVIMKISAIAIPHG